MTMTAADAVIEVLSTVPVCADFTLTAENKFLVNPNTIFREEHGPEIRAALQRNRPEVLELFAEAETAELPRLYETARALATELFAMESGAEATPEYQEKLGLFKRALALYQIACRVAVARTADSSQLQLEIGA